MSSAQNSLSFLALGGINEIGKNMYVIQYGEDMVVVDCGAKFSEHNILGVDLIIPDMSYLLEHQEKVKALIVTHGHEDHIGGIPYFLKKLNIPVYATSFTLGLIETKLKEHKILRESELHIITADSEITLGEMSVSFFRVSHSIPDCLGIVFDTPEGKVVHTGDFKFDLTPVNDQSSDIHKMAKMGDEGVLALISESTNAERPGMTPSEMLVGAHLEEAFLRAKQKIFISTFASNVNRVQQVVDACIRTNRKLALLGRSMVNVVQVARERGYLQMPDWMLVNARDVHEIPSERIAILCTGSQGEPLAALSRLSTNSNRDVKVHPGDTVILAASPIPGNEKDVSRVVDNLFRLGAHVIYGSASITGMHVSGHGYQEDLKLMLTLMKPKFFIPIHGEYRMLHIHRQLAETIGVEKDNTFILRNGDVVDIQDGTARQTRQVSAGDTYVDGYGIGEVGQVVLRDRKQLSEDGMLVIVVTVSKTDASLISAPEIISRGFVYAKDAEELMTTLADVVKETIENFKEPNIFAMKQALKKAVGQYISTHTKRKPLLLPIIIEF
ncbi:ribonuclease J [Lysinibacillus odysseyi]|uniref:Ribonuclease J n=1 Tax=Lysinibacillus odysseyi 34hs-1 = NBRC 100172 TaxID=1220589 RepID=A0A0A3JJ49_9BACI|nr:ribonuclease J [Lysinibacillus odysseyi]KGR87022.1 ribonuclease J [Lysinibacillus odysseyi 34hs-1 = NBRC 100172]